MASVPRNLFCVLWAIFRLPRLGARVYRVAIEGGDLRRCVTPPDWSRCGLKGRLPFGSCLRGLYRARNALTDCLAGGLLKSFATGNRAI
jgi:hypothetical protein